MTGKVAVIRIGAGTSVELKDTMLRAEDSLAAAQAALEEGVVAGGGTALVQAADCVDLVELVGDAVAGREAVRRALSEPLRWIAIIAGFDGDEVVATVAGSEPGIGFDAATGQYGSMHEFGIIDPLKITRYFFSL